ncbi:MAG: D-aminoacyl-tRNA deacylase [Bacteroidota bacterium]|nr:D-aminoacyl-tRNA deacylase [Bacteroidota bacterium]MEC7286515.1 D-aminoacyl-tRNA deacylase [Bacteroidota bacterium]MEC8098334.1 D-aminoacyl-tRNA deacylase [Bacteroidota bacterium]MEC9160607.1 D-aminoacyl-tRNA deacylase [Bacteroidota bacterium]MED5364488.1 D-aminoacyl-tRNA deacylase [Bacteroidota bacterium]|tara:strand:+ start:2030 stop:2485 length:456 start_codon:yes stop_codon:yes gene_type:complete
MRAVIQRVSYATLFIDDEVYSKINKGLLILIGVENNDRINDIKWLAKKICEMRIFSDSNKKLNLSVRDILGEIMVVSQFTLLASTKKGNRPSYIKALKPKEAIKVYNNFIAELEKTFMKKIKTGLFGKEMKIELENDGPVTIIIDSKNKDL